MTAMARELGHRIPFLWHRASLTWGWQKVTGMAEPSLPSGSYIYMASLFQRSVPPRLPLFLAKEKAIPFHM